MKNQNTKKLAYAALFLALCLVLPMLTGQIPQIGTMLLPMHIPVLLCGLGENPPDFVVADCPFATLHDQLMYNVGSMKHLPSWPFEGPAEWILRARAGFGYSDVSPLDELKRANGAPELPVLFIHGTADRLIPYDNTLRLYDAKRGKKALYICPGAGHVRSISTDREKYYAVVNEFLDKYGF